MSKKLIAITNHSYMFWQFRRELMQELQKDYEIIISTPFAGHEQDFADLGFRMIETDVDRRGINPVRDFGLLCRYFSMLKKERPDMVLTYSIKPNIYAGAACRLLGIPYCVNVQGLGTAFQSEPLATVASFLYRLTCKGAKTVFFENTGNADIFVSRGILKKDRPVVLPGAGINLEYYKSAPYPRREQLRFLYLGRIMREKGMDELFYAMEKLYSELGGRVKLDLVGFFEDEYKPVVDRLVERGIADFHGFQSDPRPFYANADCIVLPSYHEGLSNVLLEAAATGRCVITSNIHGCMETVDDGRTGFLCRVKDGEDLYKKMKYVALLSAGELEQLGKNGRAKMEKEFEKSKVVDLTKEHITGQRG